MSKFNFSARVAQLDAIVKEAKGIKDRKDAKRKAAARAARKLQQIAVFQELLKLIPADAKLSDKAAEYINSLTVEYKPGVQLDIQIGDSLVDLLKEYKDVRDLYKKILKWCDQNNAKIDGVNIVAK